MEIKKPQYALLEEVMEHSLGETWEEAQPEWHIVDYWRREGSTCVCGKEDIVHCFTIHNYKTKHSLSPIGSSCVKKFRSKQLDEELTVYERMFVLGEKFKKFIDVDDLKPFLSNKYLLDFLADCDIFDDYRQFEFYKKMVRMRKDPSVRQQKYFKSLIFFKVKPFVIDFVKDLTPSDNTVRD